MPPFRVKPEGEMASPNTITVVVLRRYGCYPGRPVASRENRLRRQPPRKAAFFVPGRVRMPRPAFLCSPASGAASPRTVPSESLSSVLAAAVVNFQTPDLLETAVRSFHRAYPEVRVLVVDNGSQDGSPELIRRLARELGPVVEPMLLAENRYHGPAMHAALEHLSARYVYFFDSDTETQKTGFLEPMVALLDAAPEHYGAGQLVHVNRRGFVAPGGIPVLTSWHMVLKRSIYHRLPPFIHHGLPVLQNFRAAADEGYKLLPFPIEDYVRHMGRGTVSRFGYSLGFRSRLDYLLNKLGL